MKTDVRGQGVGRSLVEAAVSFARDRGARSVDGPPPWWKAGGDGLLRAGTVRVFESVGFKQVEEGARMPVLRMGL